MKLITEIGAMSICVLTGIAAGFSWGYQTSKIHYSPSKVISAKVYRRLSDNLPHLFINVQTEGMRNYRLEVPEEELRKIRYDLK